MDHITDAMEMVDHMPYPAFCVQEGTIVKVNPAGILRMIDPGTAIRTLIHTGADEYAEFTGGCLYLCLSLCGQCIGASVTRKKDFDLFVLEQDANRSELQAMALAARELREPLASIMITMDRLLPMHTAASTPEAQEQVARINRGLYQMLRVISNMSDANRYANDTPARQEVRDICAIVDEVMGKAAALAECTGIQLEYSAIAKPIITLVDTEKLERAILNIISNAMKFTPCGGRILASLTHRGDKLYFSVQDEGPGICDSLRGDIFSRYTRDPGVEDGRFGIGLGLVLIRTAATLHGGTVLVDHPRDTGTRITMTMAIRPGSGKKLHSPVLKVDYAGERDHGLLELSDVLPADLYDSRIIN